MKNKKKNIILTILTVLSLVTPLFNQNVVLAEENANLISTKDEVNTSQNTSNTDTQSKTKREFYDNNDTLPDIKVYSKAALLVDTRTGKILYNKNAKERKYPASTTKIMTAILTIENCNLDDKVVVDYESISLVPSGYTVAALQVGEEVTVRQLLQMLLVPSANDAANVLAKHVGGSIESFASMMNTKANEIGCLDTHFTNPSGKHDDNHYSTAYDLALIMDYCIQNPTFVEMASNKSCIIPATNKYEQRIFTNTDEMFNVDTREVSSNYYYPYLIAAKTGYTSEAGNCLVSAADKDGQKYICIVLDGIRTDEGLSARFVDTKTLFEYGYNTYTVKKVFDKGSIAKQIEVSNATKDTKQLDLLTSDEINVLIKQANVNDELEPEFVLNENIEAPIQKGDVLGKIIYNIEGIKYEANLTASHEVEKDNFIFLILQIVLILFIIFLIYKLINSKKSRRKKVKNYHY